MQTKVINNEKFFDAIKTILKSNMVYHKTRTECFEKLISSIDLTSAADCFPIDWTDYNTITSCLSSKNATFNDDKLLALLTTAQKLFSDHNIWMLDHESHKGKEEKRI
jgi:hypothetical protein